MLVVGPVIGDSTSASPDLEAGIVGYARSIPDAVVLAADLHPDVIVLDDQLARDDADGGLAALRRASPEASIFIVTDVRHVLELACGHKDVAGYLNRARLRLAMTSPPPP
jgi:chemotaxis response regulator CheB